MSARKVDVESIASDVFSELNCLDTEDLWDRSGATRHGYVDPDDESLRMIKEALDPHIKKMKRYHSKGMLHEELLCCVGIISGLNEFENESNSEFKDWAGDAPSYLANHILDDWKKSCKDPELMKAMDDFLSKQ